MVRRVQSHGRSETTTWLDSLEDLSVPRRWYKIFYVVPFSSVTAEGRVSDSKMNGFSSFSGNSFAVLTYYIKVGDVGSGLVI